MVTSVDHPDGGAYLTMHSYSLFSSADLVNWTDHGTALNIEDLEGYEPENEDWALWAPDMIYDDGKYYIIYPLRIKPRSDTDGGRDITQLGVAVSENPEGPYTVIQSSIEGNNIGIDPCVFRDDDGIVYIYHGPGRVGILKQNLIEFEEQLSNIDSDEEDTLKNDATFQAQWTGTATSKTYGSGNMMEAPWLHKRNGRYFYMYHTYYGSTVKDYEDDPTRRKSNLDYSYGDSPVGSFKYGGTLNGELGSGVYDYSNSLIQYYTGYNNNSYIAWRPNQSNHGGIVEFHGDDYLFYHTSALSSWVKSSFSSSGSWTMRSVCVDKIEYDQDDMPTTVKQTVTGVDAVKITQSYDIYLAEDVDFDNATVTPYEY